MFSSFIHIECGQSVQHTHILLSYSLCLYVCQSVCLCVFSFILYFYIFCRHLDLFDESTFLHGLLLNSEDKMWINDNWITCIAYTAHIQYISLFHCTECMSLVHSLCGIGTTFINVNFITYKSNACTFIWFAIYFHIIIVN